MSTIDIIAQRDMGTIEGFDIIVRLTPDDDESPEDFACYDAETIKAYKCRAWHYVSTEVIASRAGIELGHAWLGGSEYGDMPGVEEFVNPLDGDGDQFVNGYGPQLIAEAIEDARATLDKINGY